MVTHEGSRGGSVATVFNWLKQDVKLFIFEASFSSRVEIHVFQNWTCFNLFSLNLDLFGFFQNTIALEF